MDFFGKLKFLFKMLTINHGHVSVFDLPDRTSGGFEFCLSFTAQLQ